jgi:hypothetical protein
VYGLLVVVLVFVLLVYGAWLVLRIHSGIKRIMPELPPCNQLSWAYSGRSGAIQRVIEGEPVARALPSAADTSGQIIEAEQDRSESTPFARVVHDPLTWAAAADGAVAGGAILESALKIDPQVLHAIEFSTAQDLHGLSDFHTYVQDHFFSTPVDTADGWFNRLTGYVAEQKAASFFEHAGHHVMMAPVANQPVWDMLVDGHPVQIKENLAAVKDFAVAHPDIPVFTDPHIAASSHLDSVHGLSVLDKDSIHSATANTVDGLDGSFDPGFHFPVITLACSAIREVKLLFAEKTTFDRAFVHVSMDVVGVGGGALLGAKIGAFVGSVAPGPGTIIGGILGSILGGITGKMASRGASRLPFHNARNAYNETIGCARTAIDGKVEYTKGEVRRLQQEYQTRFQRFRSQVESEATEKINEFEQAYSSKLLESYLRFPNYLRDLSKQLVEEQAESLSEMPRPGLLHRLFPNEECLRRQAVRAWFRRARRTVKEQARHFQQIKPRTIEALHAAVQTLLREFVFDLKSLENDLEEVANFQGVQQRAAEEVRQQAITQIEEHRQSLIKEFGSQVSDLHDEVVRFVQLWNVRISAARNELRRQAEAVGISI